MRIFLFFLLIQITFNSNLIANEIDLNDPYFKLGWKNLNNSTNKSIEIPNTNASIEIVDSEIYLDTKEDIKNYEEYLYSEETSIDDISESLIISDKEQYYTIKARYYDDGYVTTDRFKNFTSKDIIETFNKRKSDSMKKITWILEPTLTENKVSNYGYRVNWPEGDVAYVYLSNILGRNGFLQLKMTLMGDGNENDDFFNYYQSIIEEISSTVKFNDKFRYSDFAQGDYISSYTLTNIIDGSWGQGVATDLTNIEAYCLVTTGALKKAGITEVDYPRFAGKVITFYITDVKNEIIDISSDDDVSVLSGMYGIQDIKNFQKLNISPSDPNTYDVSYTNIIELVGDKATDKVKYEYKNKLVIKEGIPKILFAKIDQTGLSFNKWNLTLGCQDKEYTAAEKQKAKKFASSNLLKGTNGEPPPYFFKLAEKMKELGLKGKDIQTRNLNTKNSNETKETKVANSSYSIFIEEDFDTVLFLNKTGGSVSFGGRKLIDGKIISYGGYEYFKVVYDRNDNKATTFIQPASMSKDGKMESYMKDGFQVDNFIWKFDVRDDDQIMISSSPEYLKQLKAYEASDTMFSISTLTDEFWYAGTFKLVKNLDDLLEIYNNKKTTYCSILKEKFIQDGFNTEIQYIYKDYLDFNARKNINC